MKNLKYFLLGLLFFTSTLACAAGATTLNDVTYQLSAQQWVKTNRARIDVSVNATTSGQNITKLRQSILSNLQKIVAGEWHITHFNRSKTSSGLESVNVQAQIRVPNHSLTDLHQRAKAVSKAGQTYQIQSVNFNPNLADMETAKNQLREKIYKQVRKELKDLNAEYSGQKYFVHQIRFSGMRAVPEAMILRRMPTPDASNLTVSQKITMTATVTLSSLVKQ